MNVVAGMHVVDVMDVMDARGRVFVTEDGVMGIVDLKTTGARPSHGTTAAESLSTETLDGAGGVRVERGPDWLFLAIDRPAVDGGDLAEGICRLVQASMVHRVVLELDRIDAVDERIAEAIGRIGTRVQEDGGIVRICGLSDENLSRLQGVSAAASLPHFGSRAEAVGGHDHRGWIP